MKLRIIYGCTYGAYGFILGLFGSLILFAVIAGALWLFVFGDNVWPEIAYKILGFVHIGVFMGAFFGSIILGVKKAIKLEKEGDYDKILAKASVHLVWVGVLMIFFSFGLFRYGSFENSKNLEYQEQKTQITELLSNHREIETIKINQVDEGINVSVLIPGLAEGVFTLTLKLVANGYVKDDLMSFNNDVALNLSKQEFNFYISFEQLAEKYRKKLLNYIPFFEKEFHIDEYIELKAQLVIKNNDKYDLSMIESIELPVSEKIEILRFNFSCFGEKCKVLQSDESKQKEN